MLDHVNRMMEGAVMVGASYVATPYYFLGAGQNITHSYKKSEVAVRGAPFSGTTPTKIER